MMDGQAGWCIAAHTEVRPPMFTLDSVSLYSVCFVVSLSAVCFALAMATSGGIPLYENP